MPHPVDPDTDRRYNVRALVGEARVTGLIARYRAESEGAVGDVPAHRDVRYDEHSAQRLDVWAPGTARELRPVFVYLHGGYWRALSRAESAFMVGTLAGDGIATAVVEYRLAPAVTLEEIVREVRAAVAWIYHHAAELGVDRRRIVVGGSSAGGHLTGMVMLDTWQRAFGLPVDAVAAAMPFSGLFDLRPLLRTRVNGWLGLDEERARALSPGLRLPTRGLPARIVVAEHDGPGFLDQSREFFRSWSSRFPGATLDVVPDRNHYDVVLDLGDPDSALSRALVELCQAP